MTITASNNPHNPKDVEQEALSIEMFRDLVTQLVPDTTVVELTTNKEQFTLGDLRLSHPNTAATPVVEVKSQSVGAYLHNVVEVLSIDAPEKHATGVTELAEDLGLPQGLLINRDVTVHKSLPEMITPKNGGAPFKNPNGPWDVAKGPLKVKLAAVKARYSGRTLLNADVAVFVNVATQVVWLYEREYLRQVTKAALLSSARPIDVGAGKCEPQTLTVRVSAPTMRLHRNERGLWVAAPAQLDKPDLHLAPLEEAIAALRSILHLPPLYAVA